MNRLIVFGPIAVLVSVAMGVAGLLSWNKISSFREHAAAIERRNKFLEGDRRTLHNVYQVLTLQLDADGFRDFESMQIYVRSKDIETEAVLAHMATHESLVKENFPYLPTEKFTYPAMVQVLGDRLRETEARLKLAEAKLRDISETGK
jgi:hypothetical protein